jgi:hypothetical protein
MSSNQNELLPAPSVETKGIGTIRMERKKSGNYLAND